jgi:tRNA modification GTPase
VVLYGAPNAGKSTLLNALVGSDRALVDHRPGTTRDTLEVRTAPHGQLITWVDAAGVRQTEDPVERMGTERAIAAVVSADVVLWCQDHSQPPPANLPPPPVPPQAVLLRVYTKADLPPFAPSPSPACAPPPAWTLCAHRPSDVDALREAVMAAVAQLAAGPVGSGVVLTRQRHADALAQGMQALDRAVQTLQHGDPLELTAADLRDAVSALDELTGGVHSDEVLGAIFSSFCIGK